MKRGHTNLQWHVAEHELGPRYIAAVLARAIPLAKRFGLPRARREILHASTLCWLRHKLLYVRSLLSFFFSSLFFLLLLLLLLLLLRFRCCRCWNYRHENTFAQARPQISELALADFQLVNPDVSNADKQKLVGIFMSLPFCCLDPMFGRPLRKFVEERAFGYLLDSTWQRVLREVALALTLNNATVEDLC